MEKNRILDAFYNTICLTIITILLSSCSLPRIILFHDPLTPEEHINLGVSYENKGELDAALKEYETASKKSQIAYLYMGNIYFQKNDFENAEKYYRKAIKKTDDPRAYNNLAWLYYTMDTKLQEAEKLARKAVELSPDSTDFKDTLDRIIEKGGHAR
ncbi:MAG: tetratricopeptide repeat protein [Proteobacteria bacterium]|nr:tetratricopeptide repeat protein [Pseudomonadota bacterium]